MPTNVIESIGAGKDYAGVEVWEGATDNDHVAADELVIGQMYDDTAATDRVRISGSTSDATRYRILEAAPGLEYDPITDTGIKYSRIAIGNELLETAESNLHLRRFCVITDASETGSCVEAGINTGLNTVLDRMCFRPLGTGNAIKYNDSKVTASNCIAIGVGSGVGFSHNSTGTGSKFYNCTAYNFNNGFVGPSAGVADTVYQNCASVGSLDDDFLNLLDLTFGTYTNNLSSDDHALGTSAQFFKSATDTFTDPVNDDFTIKKNSAAIGTGADLSATVPFDYTGAARTVPYDIGAYKFVFPLLRPRGLRTTTRTTGVLS